MPEYPNRTTGLTSIRDLPNTMFAVHPAGHEKAGMTVEREQTCRCGRVYTQSLLSNRELEAAARMGVLDRMVRQIPDGYVPVECPACERKALTRQAHIDEARTSSTVPDSRRDYRSDAA